MVSDANGIASFSRHALLWRIGGATTVYLRPPRVTSTCRGTRYSPVTVIYLSRRGRATVCQLVISLIQSLCLLSAVARPRQAHQLTDRRFFVPTPERQQISDSRFAAPCANCGKLLTREKSWAERVKHFFCNRKCHNEWQSRHSPRGKKSPKYKSVEVSCAHCGTPLVRPPHRVKAYRHQFCDNTCAALHRSQSMVGPNHPQWKGGSIDSYGPNWRQQKAKARKRDGYRCQRCGVHESELPHRLDVHHIKPFREFGIERYREANRLSNLVSLCRSCHIQVER